MGCAGAFNALGCAGQKNKKDLKGAGNMLGCPGCKNNGEGRKTVASVVEVRVLPSQPVISKLTWLVLGADPAARSHRVEQFTAL